MNSITRIILITALVSLTVPAFAESSVHQCFYECKRSVTGTTFAEVTTLMIANENQLPAPGDHSDTHIATLVLLNGNERVLARARTYLSGRDLDEVNICATLQQASGECIRWDRRAVVDEERRRPDQSQQSGSIPGTDHRRRQDALPRPRSVGCHRGPFVGGPGGRSGTRCQCDPNRTDGGRGKRGD